MSCTSYNYVISMDLVDRDSYVCAVCGLTIPSGEVYLRRQPWDEKTEPVPVHRECGPPPIEPLRNAVVTSRTEPAKRKRGSS